MHEDNTQHSAFEAGQVFEPRSSGSLHQQNPGRVKRFLRGLLWVFAGFACAGLGFSSSFWFAKKESQVQGDNQAQNNYRSQNKEPRKVRQTASKNIIKSKPKKDQRAQIRKNSHWTQEVMNHNKRLPERHVAALLREVGFPAHSIPKMVCTARFESAFDTDAKNENRNGSRDVGLFQINEIWEKPCGMNKKDLMDPVKNAQCAKLVFEESGYWAWYGYRKNRVTCKNYAVRNTQRHSPGH
jgi:hypothetical protein